MDEKKEFLLSKKGLYALIDIDVYGTTLPSHRIKLAGEEDLKKGFTLGGVRFQLENSDMKITMDSTMPDLIQPDAAPTTPEKEGTLKKEPYYKFDPDDMKELTLAEHEGKYFKVLFRKPGPAQRYGKDYYYINAYYCLYHLGSTPKKELKGLTPICVRADLLGKVYRHIENDDTHKRIAERVKRAGEVPYGSTFIYNVVKLLSALGVVDIRRSPSDARRRIIIKNPAHKWADQYWVSVQYAGGKE